MSHDIFISYSRRDSERMGQVRDTLRESGLMVWTDEGIEPGTESWKGSISGAITGCKAVVVLFSPDAPQSTWVNRELDFAERHRKKIYPLLVRGELTESIPFGYTAYQYIDIREDEDVSDGIQQLAETLHAHISGVSPLTMASPSPSHSPVRQDVNRMSSTRPDDYGETLWKWIETPAVRFTVPSTWKVNEPTPEHIQKMQILMTGKDGRLFSRAVEDFNRGLVHQATGIPLGRTTIAMVMTDIAEMSLLTGSVSIYSNPIPTAGRVVRLMTSFLERRITRFARLRHRSDMSQFLWGHSSMGRILSCIWQTSSIIENTQPMKGKLYFLYLPLSNPVLSLHITCEPERFKREERLFDQVARSLQFVGMHDLHLH